MTPSIMIKLLILLLLIVFLPLTISAQSVKITNEKVQEIIENIEPYAVELIEVKTLRKWKALELSSDMKPQMDYNVVRVRYQTEDKLKTVLIDMHMVPILFDVKKTTVKTTRKEDYITLSYSD